MSMTTTQPMPTAATPEWPQAEHIERIRESFAALRATDREAGLLFYERLFTIAPRVRPLFPASLDAQSEKLFQTLRVLLASLERLDTIVPVLRDLGRRHVAYGARAEHYAAVGEALLWTLATALGDAFTPEARADWTQLYQLVAAEMQRGAEAPHAA